MDMDNIFGDWIHHLPNLSTAFQNAKPFEHVVIPNFFHENVATSIDSIFPDINDSFQDWKHYDNPIEQKYSLNNFDNLPLISHIFHQVLQSPEMVKMLQQITGIPTLEADPHLHGAGLHAYPNQGKLDIHLDYSIHPITQKERRCNLIIYLNRHWKKEYGGDLQMWDASLKECTQLVSPSWNTAVLFRTSDISYHGIPRPIQCPDSEARRSLAIYYVSQAREEAKPRYKAEFFPHPDQEVSPQLQKLYEIRKHRIIQPQDLQDWPNWRWEGDGWW